MGDVPTSSFVEHIMGMPMVVTVRGSGAADTAVETAVEEVFADLRWADDVLSPYKEDSELSRIQRGELSFDAAAQEVREVKALSEEAARVTLGYFDAQVPTGDGLTRWDPTGLTKGWAVQRAARQFDAVHGIEWAINAAGDILTGSSDADTSGPPWRVGLEAPWEKNTLAHVMEVPASGGALATSGTAVHGAHIYNPKSGERRADLASVTVTGPTLVWADIWATALFVGSDEAYRAMLQWSQEYDALLLAKP